jgi:hypothetical protein
MMMMMMMMYDDVMMTHGHLAYIDEGGHDI